jgi:hypothetical protein
MGEKMKKRKKKFKFKIDVLSAIIIMVSFVSGMAYQDFIGCSLFNNERELTLKLLGSFLGSKITFHTNLENKVYMFTLHKEEKLNKILLEKNKDGKM